jgi:hypothetical protein
MLPGITARHGVIGLDMRSGGFARVLLVPGSADHQDARLGLRWEHTIEHSANYVLRSNVAEFFVSATVRLSGDGWAFDPDAEARIYTYMVFDVDGTSRGAFPSTSLFHQVSSFGTYGYGVRQWVRFPSSVSFGNVAAGQVLTVWLVLVVRATTYGNRGTVDVLVDEFSVPSNTSNDTFTLCAD